MSQLSNEENERIAYLKGRKSMWHEAMDRRVNTDQVFAEWEELYNLTGKEQWLGQVNFLKSRKNETTD